MIIFIRIQADIFCKAYGYNCKYAYYVMRFIF